MNVTSCRLPVNYHKVDNFLMRSALPSVEELANLHQKEHLTDIFNISDNTPLLAKNAEIYTAKALKIKYHEIPTSTSNPQQKNVKKFLSEMKRLKQNKKSKVLLHCNAGTDRTGLFVAIYQLTNKLKTYPEAIHDMFAKGHFPDFAPGILPAFKKIATNMKLIR